MEGKNLEFKRRTRKIVVFPTEQTMSKLVVSIMMDINGKKITGRGYTVMGVN